MRLENRTALITGASRNIGREIALTFAREGAILILNTRNSSAELEEVANECRAYEVKVITAIADVSDESSVNQMVSNSFKTFDQVDILVNNAAIRPHKPLLETSYKDWREVIDINLDPCI